MKNMRRCPQLVQNHLDQLRQDMDWQLLERTADREVLAMLYKMSEARAPSWHTVADQLKVITDLLQCYCSQ